METNRVNVSGKRASRLAQSETFRQLADAMPQIVWTAKPDGTVDYASQAFTDYTGMLTAELPGQRWVNAIHPGDAGRCLAAWTESVGNSAPYSVEFRIRRGADNSYRWHLTRAVPIRDETGDIVKWYGTATDIHDSKQSKLALERLNRALRMLSTCNEVLVHGRDENQLLTDICRLAVEIGGYRMAWVGYAQNNEAKSIQPVAHAGQLAEADYLDNINLSWSATSPRGQGPGGRTIRGGEPVVCEDITKNPNIARWLASVQHIGYRGLISLPLREKDRTFGILALYFSEARAVAEEEIRLLQELADNLAFGICNMRSQRERQRIESAVLKVAAGVSASTGTEFFEQLARNMAEALGADAGFVARLLPGTPIRARVISAVVDGKVAENFEYAIKGTPCERFLHDSYCIVTENAAKRFPRSRRLAAFGAQAYVGRRLDNSAGQPVGLLYALFRKPVTQLEFMTSTLQIFAARVAGELERQVADARIRDQASLLDKAQDAIIVCGIDHQILFWNKGAERLYGWTAEEALGKSKVELLCDDAAVCQEATDVVYQRGDWSGEMMHRRKDGSALTIEGHWTLVRNDQGNPESIFTINTDITHRRIAEREIQYLAFYDPLTGLPNRRLLIDRLQQVLASSTRSQHTGALLFIDLDNFKSLNDTLGHDIGDVLLQHVALRLKSFVRKNNTVARLGGDEFVIVLDDLSEKPHEAATQAKVVGEKILGAFNEPFQLPGYQHHCTPSIGATLFNDQPSVDELLKRADLAMYQAKAAGRNTMRFFDPEMQKVITERVALETDFRQSLQQQDFHLYYQPQTGSDGRTMGTEALVRWKHPVRGTVSPAEFIPLAEETGLIHPLGHWVLETACTQLAVWGEQTETAQLSIAVNVSARQFRHPDFVEQVLQVLELTGANPKRLKLELTESLLVDDMELTIAKMTALKERGVGFSLDDFGTGYSSLSYLKRLPLDQLKIDQSFVRDVLTDAHDAAIARTIVALGQSLGLTVIAEGVETMAQRDVLAEYGCDAYQGYLFSRPLPADQFNQFFKSHH